VDEFKATDPTLAHHIHLYYTEYGRFTTVHRRRLQQISELPGFSGSLEPGTYLASHSSLPPRDPLTAANESPVGLTNTSARAEDNNEEEGEEEKDDDDDDDDEQVDLVCDALMRILSLS
jgi:hypothetical protein